tara:strand:+ start:8923 stop:9132 length:210 start_codon:yes stop_codon:yes gene_type:complete
VSERHRLNGKAAMKVRIWFRGFGESPNKPYTDTIRFEERWAGVPGELMKPDKESLSISTDNGDTPDCEF